MKMMGGVCANFLHPNGVEKGNIILDGAGSHSNGRFRMEQAVKGLTGSSNAKRNLAATRRGRAPNSRFRLYSPSN